MIYSVSPIVCAIVIKRRYRFPDSEFIILLFSQKSCSSLKFNSMRFTRFSRISMIYFRDFRSCHDSRGPFRLLQVANLIVLLRAVFMDLITICSVVSIVRHSRDL